MGTAPSNRVRALIKRESKVSISWSVLKLFKRIDLRSWRPVREEVMWIEVCKRPSLQWRLQNGSGGTLSWLIVNLGNEGWCVALLRKFRWLVWLALRGHVRSRVFNRHLVEELVFLCCEIILSYHESTTFGRSRRIDITQSMIVLVECLLSQTPLRDRQVECIIRVGSEASLIVNKSDVSLWSLLSLLCWLLLNIIASWS